MAALAAASNMVIDAGPFGSDRIDVIDEAGIRIGSIDPRTGARNLLLPERAAEFEEMVRYWLTAAGLTSGADDTVAQVVQPTLKVNEVRYPDAHIIRSLLIPLIPLDGGSGH